jgi:hypothetical protein
MKLRIYRQKYNSTIGAKYHYSSSQTEGFEDSIAEEYKDIEILDEHTLYSHPFIGHQQRALADLYRNN